MSTSLLERFEAVADTTGGSDWLDVERRARRHRRPRRLVLIAATAAALLGVATPAVALVTDDIDRVLDAIVDRDREHPTPQAISLVVMPSGEGAEARITGRVNDPGLVVRLELQFLGELATPLPVDAEGRFRLRVPAERLRETPAMITGFDAEGREVVSILTPPVAPVPSLPEGDAHSRLTA